MDPNIFRKFSDNLRKILVLAEKIASDSGKPMDSEEMLLALTLTKNTLASDILTGFEIVTDRVQIVAKLVGNQNPKRSHSGLSENAKQVIQNSVKIAADYNHAVVDAEHLLLALISDPKLNSFSIIERIGVKPERIKQQVESIFTEISKATNGTNFFNPDAQGLNVDGLPDVEDYPEQIDRDTGKTATKEAQKSFLEQFTTNLTAMANEARLDPLIGRETEIERVTQILSRRTKNNPLLIGEPGVGKTAIVEGLARKIILGEVPQTLIGKVILSLDISSLLAGTMYRGQFESRVKKLLAEIKTAGNIILFIDEIHTTIGTGSAEGSLDTANMLKPILSRGDFRLIGATTYEEYKKHLEKDPAYERRFQIVQVKEPTVAETIKILKGLKSKYEQHHGIKFSNDAIVSAVELSDRYISDRFLPDKAIDLIDEAAAATNIVTPEGVKISKLKQKLDIVQEKKEEAVNSENYEAATNYREDEIRLSDKISALESTLSVGKKKTVDSSDIARVASRWTGINVESLSADEKAKYLHLEEKLKKTVVGQDEAINLVAKSIRRNRAGISDPERPIGSFLFLGPTGVGKTFLSKTLAEILFGSTENFIKIDMSEFMEKHNVSRLVGAPAGYVGYDDGGKLTESVRRNPHSIILFDEIEKAHPEVFNILLQILEDGYLTDAKGRRVNFKNTIVILTSNLGTSQLDKNSEIGFSNILEHSEADEKKYEKLKERVMDTLNQELRPEFINRLDSIVVFKPLSQDSINKIVELNIKILVSRLKKQDITLSVSREVKKHVSKIGYSNEFGARPIRRVISDLVEDPISGAVISDKFVSGDKIFANLINGKVVFSK